MSSPEGQRPASTIATEPVSTHRQLFSRASFRLLLLLAILGVFILVRENQFLGDRVQTFVTIFLSIFIEAAPFLLAGAMVSGFLAVFVDDEMIYRFAPRNPITAAVVGSAMGMVFPVCECGVVPVTRRLYQKGLPLSMGIAFLLAAPIVNPVVVASTYAAFGWGPMLYARVGLSFVIAAGIGLLFYLASPQEVIQPGAVHQTSRLSRVAVAHAFSEEHEHSHEHEHQQTGLGGQIWESLAIAGDDFFDMGRYLIAGSMLAAGMQTLVPQQVLLELGRGTVTSIVVLMVLAFVLSVCSTVDAFLALAFVNTFPPAAILAFLVFGPMVDVKSSLMFLGVFKRRIVVYLILLPLMATLMIAVFLNLNVG